jgi:hypothetical protein
MMAESPQARISAQLAQERLEAISALSFHIEQNQQRVCRRAACEFSTPMQIVERSRRSYATAQINTERRSL